jgi:cell division protein FtsW (lipid II flippase)
MSPARFVVSLVAGMGPALLVALVPSVGAGVLMGLLLKQPDLGTAVIFGLVALGLLV